MPIIQKMWDIAGSVSIRVKVLGIVLGVIFLLGLLVTLQARQILLETLTGRMEQQGRNISENILEHSIPLLEQGDEAIATSYLNEMQIHYSNPSHNTAINYIYITDTQNHVLTKTFEGSPPSQLEDGDKDINVTTTYEDLTLHLGLSEESILSDVNHMVTRIVYIMVLMIVIGIGAAVFLTWVLTRPILNLVDATQAIARGEFSRRITQWANDEIGAVAQSFNTMAAALEVAEKERQHQESLRNQYISGVILAQEEERKRIARELHDSTSQSLTSLLVGLRTLESVVPDSDQVQSQISDLRQVVSNTLEEVHVISRQLRPSVLDDLGLEAAIIRYANELQVRYDMVIDLIILGINDRLPGGLETTVYRIVQEALTNVARHAQATTASVLIENRNDILRIIVEDNGIGFDPETAKLKRQSLGLQGIRERASLFNGKMVIESAQGRGSSLFVEIPIS